MPVTAVNRDFDALTMTITAELDASADRVWELWSDPRQLERWWGPPSHPATFVDHDLSPGGRTTYFMTGPEGEKFHGHWRVEDVEPPNQLRFADDDTDDEGTPNDGGPAEMTVTIAEVDGTTTMSIESRFPDREALERAIEMRMEQGMTEALGQIDGLLASAGG
jgi:uncharacterized protein YndB with AHSA1/START domain